MRNLTLAFELAILPDKTILFKFHSYSKTVRGTNKPTLYTTTILTLSTFEAIDEYTIETHEVKESKRENSRNTVLI